MAEIYKDRQGRVIAEGETKIAPSIWNDWAWRQVEKMNLPEKAMEIYKSQGLNIQAKCAGCIHLKETTRRSEDGKTPIKVKRCTAWGEETDWSGQWPACNSRESKSS